ncbi:Ankyrin repeat domain-containing protein 60-like [Oopsacas minuta]|uniref:Ankyrin repeat domain-containing protein 60-like n=1 Tax=Oopsacas minuta TaxID=111878 RepID=A0AAV7JU32_9METZ|nr:Ankyrin repeat domain-containing protein 60-like [Oopsacas minuta]
MIEQDLGIPTELYRLNYLDKADLLNHCTVAQHEIVPRARVMLQPWKMWEYVLIDVFQGTISDIEDYNITNSDERSIFRAFMALFMAAHRGHSRLLEKIIRLTHVDINAHTRANWTALHAAARSNQWRCLCILIDKGADIILMDSQGKTALDLTRIYGAKKCEQSLNFCSWNLQKYNQVDRWQKDYSPYKARDLSCRLAHQTMDSTNPAWMKGKLQRRYLAVYDNPISIKECDSWDRNRSERSISPKSYEIKSATPENIFNYGWFDPQRAKEFIPDTQTMLTFSDPAVILKMSKFPSTPIVSLESKIVKKRENVVKASFSEWLVGKVNQERYLKEEMKLKREREKHILSQQKREREIKSRMSYLRWIHNKDTNKDGLTFKEELDEISRESRK